MTLNTSYDWQPTDSFTEPKQLTGANIDSSCYTLAGCITERARQSEQNCGLHQRDLIFYQIKYFLLQNLTDDGLW